jgi:pimeloyl-[acyl-carrier protein] methyl ester esterase
MGSADKVPIVLLPGMDGSGVLLRGLVEHLAVFRPVRVIPFPNDKPLTYEELTTHVLERLPDSRAVLLGESFSGPIAIEIAARQQRIAGLVLAASFACHPMPALFSPLTRMLDLRWVPARLVETVLLGSAATPDLRETLRRVLATLPREVIRTRAAEVLRIDKRHRLRAVSCPILYLRARFDRLVSRKCLEEIVSSRPHCEVRTLDAPHMVLETHPVETASIVNGFCAQFV